MLWRSLHACLANKESLKKTQIFETHTTFKFGLAQNFPSNSMHSPTINMLPPPKSSYQILNFIAQTQGKFEASHSTGGNSLDNG